MGNLKRITILANTFKDANGLTMSSSIMVYITNVDLPSLNYFAVYEDVFKDCTSFKISSIVGLFICDI